MRRKVLIITSVALLAGVIAGFIFIFGGVLFTFIEKDIPLLLNPDQSI